MKTWRLKTLGNCAWCLRQLDRLGICAGCAKNIREGFEQEIWPRSTKHIAIKPELAATKISHEAG